MAEIFCFFFYVIFLLLCEYSTSPDVKVLPVAVFEESRQ